MTGRDWCESLEFDRGAVDGKRDGAAGVKPLGEAILKRHYSSSYRAGYDHGYKAATGVQEAEA